MGRDPDLIGELQRDFGKLGVVGEETNRLLLYVAMSSRKTDDPLAIQILSSSGAGKSHLQDVVLSLCPDEDLVKLTSLTGQALFYKGEESLRHKCLALAEVAGAGEARYALRNLISEKRLTIETTVRNSLTGRLETQLNIVRGPTAVFETTTNPETDAETRSRYLLLSVDESPAQTRAILESQRRHHTLKGRSDRTQRQSIIARHHAFQRLLEPVPVINPFEPLLGFGDTFDGGGRLTLRRDHPKYLGLILAVTFLHQMQRPRNHDPGIGSYVETTLADIAIANELAHEVFGHSLDDLSFPGRQLLRLTGDYVLGRAAEHGGEWAKVEFTRRQLREALHWSESRLRLHLGQLLRLEYVGSTAGRFGQRYMHRLLIDPAEIELGGRCVPGLKSVEQLAREMKCLGGSDHAGRDNNLAPTSQGSACEVSSLRNPHGYKVSGGCTSRLADNGEKHVPTIRAQEAGSVATMTAGGKERS